MTQKERHFEFMKACIQGLLPKLPLVDQMGEHGIKVPDKNVYNHEVMQSCVALADAALAEFEKRWPEESCSHENFSGLLESPHCSNCEKKL